MISVVPKNASHELVLDIIKGWVDVLAQQNYQAVFDSLGHSISRTLEPSAASIRQAIESYRSPEYYPGVSAFAVSDWRMARGGNASPQRAVMWFKPNLTRMAGAAIFDLPLNGQWSDLTADFVMFETDREDGGYNLALEDLCSAKQLEREQKDADDS